MRESSLVKHLNCEWRDLWSVYKINPASEIDTFVQKFGLLVLMHILMWKLTLDKLGFLYTFVWEILLGPCFMLFPQIRLEMVLQDNDDVRARREADRKQNAK